MSLQCTCMQRHTWLIKKSVAGVYCLCSLRYVDTRLLHRCTQQVEYTANGLEHMPTSSILSNYPEMHDTNLLIYTYKRVVCVCLSVCFLSATRHLSTLRRCLRVREQEQSRAAPRARASMHSESTRAHAVQLLNEKIAALMPFKNKTVRARMLSYTYLPRFSKKGKRKPTCHFPSSVYSLPSLGVFTFWIVLNRILHKSSLLAPMESRRTRRPTFTAEERQGCASQAVLQFAPLLIIDIFLNQVTSVVLISLYFIHFMTIYIVIRPLIQSHL